MTTTVNSLKKKPNKPALMRSMSLADKIQIILYRIFEMIQMIKSRNRKILKKLNCKNPFYKMSLSLKAKVPYHQIKKILVIT